jgi:hypothetical protein
MRTGETVSQLLHKAIVNIEGIHESVHDHERDEIRQGECAICLAHVCLLQARAQLAAEAPIIDQPTWQVCTEHGCTEWAKVCDKHAWPAPGATREQAVEAVELAIFNWRGCRKADAALSTLEALGVVRFAGGAER